MHSERNRPSYIHQSKCRTCCAKDYQMGPGCHRRELFLAPEHPFRRDPRNRRATPRNHRRMCLRSSENALFVYRRLLRSGSRSELSILKDQRSVAVARKHRRRYLALLLTKSDRSQHTFPAPDRNRGSSCSASQSPRRSIVRAVLATTSPPDGVSSIFTTRKVRLALRLRVSDAGSCPAHLRPC